MNIWWTSMTAFEHIYWAIALTFSLILGIQLIIACISGLEFNSGSDLDVHHGGDIGTHFQLLTIRNIVAFFAIFGWSGITLYHQHLSTVLVIILSFLCGLVMMFICAAIYMNGVIEYQWRIE